MNGHHHKLLKELAKDNKLSQRELSRRLRLSLGRVNYVLNALITSGFIKAMRFKNSKNKMAYMYTLTPEGLVKKAELATVFLRKKMIEYNTLWEEIEELKKEIDEEQ